MPAAERSFVDETVQYVLKNKLKTVLYTWAGGISACLVSPTYEWSVPDSQHRGGPEMGGSVQAKRDGRSRSGLLSPRRSAQCACRAAPMAGTNLSQLGCALHYLPVVRTLHNRVCAPAGIRVVAAHPHLPQNHPQPCVRSGEHLKAHQPSWFKGVLSSRWLAVGARSARAGKAGLQPASGSLQSPGILPASFVLDPTIFSLILVPLPPAHALHL